MMHRLRLLPLLVAIVAAIAPLGARAQEDTVPAPRRVAGLVQPIAGIRMGFPQKLSAFVGLGVAVHRDTLDWSGWSLTVEPGLGGGLIGFGRTGMGPLAVRARIQAAVLRTWGDPWLVGPDRTYVGIDESLSFLHVGFSVGGYVKLPEDGDGPGVLFTAGLIAAL
jgi:hypothetical protein